MSILLFCFLGLLIGVLCATPEVALIVALVVGSALLLLSNTLLPVEAMRQSALLSLANPYTTLAELLRRAMLFGLSSRELLVPVLRVCAEAFALGLLVWVFLLLRARRAMRHVAVERTLAPLLIAGQEVRNLAELREAIAALSASEYRQAIKREELAQWVREDAGEIALARRLRHAGKERALRAIEKRLGR